MTSTDTKGATRRLLHSRLLRSKLRIALLALAVMTLAGFGFRYSILEATARFLEVGETPAPADLIFVLGGSPEYRPVAAAELYHRGIAPRVLLPRVRDNDANRLGVIPNETEISREILLRLGVPDSAIAIATFGEGVTSTGEDARALAAYLSTHPAERVIALTSSYHTRRARWNIRHQLKGADVALQMVGAPDPRFSAENWWRTESGVLAYTEEYVKFLHDRFYP